jgi:membrane-bound serine protease (ClpP class)
MYNFTMRQRLLIAIISTAVEETVFLVVGVWLLPAYDINIPLPVIIGIMALWLGWTVFTYRKGTHALLRKPVQGLSNMVGSTGVVVQDLSPDGLVKIHGEIWKGSSKEGNIKIGVGVIVTAQDGLRLIVRSVESAAEK